jgi:hypothetical protein
MLAYIYIFTYYMHIHAHYAHSYTLYAHPCTLYAYSYTHFYSWDLANDKVSEEEIGKLLFDTLFSMSPNLKPVFPKPRYVSPTHAHLHTLCTHTYAYIVYVHICIRYTRARMHTSQTHTYRYITFTKLHYHMKITALSSV